MGLLSQIDRGALAMYATWWARWVDLDQKLGDNVAVPGRKGDGDKDVKNPLWQPYRDASDQVLKYATAIGTTPNARLRMPVKKDEPDVSDLD